MDGPAGPHPQCNPRSQFLYRERLGLSPADHRLVADTGGAPPVLLAPGGPFATAWRNYLRSVFKRGFWYRLPCCPSVTLYVSENKTLAGKEDKNVEGEAAGRKLAVTFYEDAGGSLVQRVDKEGLALHIQLLTVAELLHTCGVAVPPDPVRTAADTELLFEASFEHLDLQRFVGAMETAAADVHTYSLSEEVNAEAAFAVELLPLQRTKMVLARCLQRNEALVEDESLQTAWALPAKVLEDRAAPFLPAPPAAEPGRGKGRGR